LHHRLLFGCISAIDGDAHLAASRSAPQRAIAVRFWSCAFLTFISSGDIRQLENERRTVLSPDDARKLIEAGTTLVHA
jgi:hypothetical protein